AADVPADELMAGELTLTGRITTASNATFLGAIGDTPVVYKPVAGEAPLWDFPAGTLARREVAAHLVSEALGWDIVPRTWLRDGPFGEGMVQLWQEQDPEQDAVDLFPADEVPAAGWLTILEGEDEDGNRLALAHEDSAALRRMTVFDVIVNNADRKGAHILAMPGGH
ncbi:SCO1664 family protein, partial [Ensifer sp. NM-2]